MTREVRILSPGGSLGYGVNAESLLRAVAGGIDVIGADSGSTDMGPYYLGSGRPYHSRATMNRDIRLLLLAGVPNRIPVLIGTGGGAGADVHVAWARAIIEEIAREEGLSFKLAVIHSEQNKDYLRSRLRAGKVEAMPGVPGLTEERLDGCERLVAQMGMEPFIKALDEGADVVLAGRACDSAIFAAFPARAGLDPGLALHVGKILECGAMSAVPPTGRDCLMAIVRDGEAEILAPNPEREVTPFSVAAHMVYEVEHPYLQGEPSGVLDFSAVTFEATDRRSTVIRGTRFHEHAMPTLRFEGAERVGYRSFVLGGIRDPYLIQQIDAYTEGCTIQTMDIAGPDTGATITWILYGRDGVMGTMEPDPDAPVHELGVLAEVLAPSLEVAHDVAALLEARMIGFPYSGAKTRTAHVAFPFSPLVNDTGPVYRFSVLHIAELEQAADLTRLFPIEHQELAG
jgi:Acyclic terpene utilisation family protein AtuA